VEIATLVDQRAAQRPNCELSELVINPEVDRAAARKKIKQRLSPFLRQHVAGQEPQTALRAKHILRDEFLWGTVSHLVIGHVQNVEPWTGAVSIFHFAPRLLENPPKATLEPDVVLKH